jgi:hypothetical protein
MWHAEIQGEIKEGHEEGRREDLAMLLKEWCAVPVAA